MDVKVRMVYPKVVKAVFGKVGTALAKADVARVLIGEHNRAGIHVSLHYADELDVIFA